MAVNEVVVNGVTELSLANDTVSETSLLEGETAHAANGEAIVGKAKYINPNLLINPDFSINQRGLTEYTGIATQNGYTVDGWRQFPSYCSVTPGGSGSGVWLANNTTADEAYSDLQQLLSEPLAVGKPYTISIELDGEVFQLTMIAAEGFQRWTVNADVSVYLSATRCLLRNFKKEGSCFIGWVKLEPGKVATPFVKPKEALELANCQSYYIPTPLVGLPVSSGANNLFFFIPLPVTMRTTPSLDGVAVVMINRSTNQQVGVSDWTLSVVNYKTNGLLVSMAKSSHGLDVKDYIIELTAGGLSAEL